MTPRLHRSQDAFGGCGFSRPSIAAVGAFMGDVHGPDSAPVSKYERSVMVGAMGLKGRWFV